METKNVKIEKSSYLKESFERFCNHKLAVFGLCTMLIIIVLLIVLPPVLKLDPYTVYAEGGFNQAPSTEHWLGTDGVGRDIFSRLIYGGRVSLLVGISTTMISMVIGVTLGLIAGFFQGWVEIVIMRIVDIFMSFPSIMLILVLVSVIGPSLVSLICIMGFLGWTSFTRLIYSKVVSVREKEYVESAVAIGTRKIDIITKYILPNSISPCLITMTFRVASSILTEASLSYLGMGVRVPTASWGNMLIDAQSISVLTNQPWAWIPPGLCLVITVLSINFFGDGLRDALDPKMKI